MCLITFAYNYHPEYPLVFLANRDEFFRRETAPLGWWDDEAVLAGRDLEAGGSWLGVNRQGDLAALTNFREGQPNLGPAPSRGDLVLGALSSPLSAPQYFATQKDKPYRGFNLLVHSSGEFHYFSNRGRSQTLSAGVYGLSNGTLNSDWPKVNKAKALLTRALEEKNPEEDQPFLDLFLDSEQAPEHELPQTGVGKVWEKMLSSIFIQTEGYGTRCTTLLTIHRSGTVRMTERSFDENGRVTGISAYAFEKEEAYAQA